MYQILKEFNDNDINLTKIESRPNNNTKWEYNFFVDLLGHFSNDKIQSVLKNISENVLFLKIIGSYPIADLDQNPFGFFALNPALNPIITTPAIITKIE